MDTFENWGSLVKILWRDRRCRPRINWLHKNTQAEYTIRSSLNGDHDSVPNAARTTAKGCRAKWLPFQQEVHHVVELRCDEVSRVVHESGQLSDIPSAHVGGHRAVDVEIRTASRCAHDLIDDLIADGVAFTIA